MGEVDLDDLREQQQHAPASVPLDLSHPSLEAEVQSPGWLAQGDARGLVTEVGREPQALQGQVVRANSLQEEPGGRLLVAPSSLSLEMTHLLIGHGRA